MHDHSHAAGAAYWLWQLTLSLSVGLHSAEPSLHGRGHAPVVPLQQQDISSLCGRFIEPHLPYIAWQLYPTFTSHLESPPGQPTYTQALQAQPCGPAATCAAAPGAEQKPSTPQISAEGLPSKPGLHSKDAEDIAALIPAVHSPSRPSPAVLPSGPHTVSPADVVPGPPCPSWCLCNDPAQ